jgi:hypothetical protein
VVFAMPTGVEKKQTALITANITMIKPSISNAPHALLPRVAHEHR